MFYNIIKFLNENKKIKLYFSFINLSTRNHGESIKLFFYGLSSKKLIFLADYEIIIKTQNSQ